MRYTIPEQLELRRELPVVIGNVDYTEFLQRLERIDELLRESGLEREWVERRLEEYEQGGRERARREGRKYKAMSWKQEARQARRFRQALRCNIARQLTEKEFRRFSRRLAESALLQWFCGVGRLELVRVPTKSTLDRHEKLAWEFEVREIVNRLNNQAVKGEVGLEKGLDLEGYFSDSTCVKAAIHFPVDWVLLRDGVRTLVKAMVVIRGHGMKERMPEPEGFIREINRLSIEMSQSRRLADSRKKRKRVLRQMKRLNRIVMKHARRYREELAVGWEERTDLKKGQVEQILRRIDGVLERLPEGIKQAHERIIGERPVANDEKILSLYERDIHVIVRGKADAEVEFGNTLWLGEQWEGLIIDWKLLKDVSPGDTKLFRSSMERIKGVFGRYPESAAGDRGLCSAANERWLESEGIFSALCPRDVEELRERMKDGRFAKAQKRRGQTEGRIAIMKNDFLGRPLRNKGFEHRELAVTWAVLAHNLWLVAGLRVAQEEMRKKKKAA
jgi:hypothetical protein